MRATLKGERKLRGAFNQHESLIIAVAPVAQAHYLLDARILWAGNEIRHQGDEYIVKRVLSAGRQDGGGAS
jgi:hypothetical protein